VAIIGSFAALALTRSLIRAGSESGARLKKAGASLLMGLTVAAMHYTGMAAANFTSGPLG
ncbi:MAG: MHYT domain-containing protein, partial [Gemmatimonadales bacterium]